MSLCEHLLKLAEARKSSAGGGDDKEREHSQAASAGVDAVDASAAQGGGSADDGPAGRSSQGSAGPGSDGEGLDLRVVMQPAVRTAAAGADAYPYFLPSNTVSTHTSSCRRSCAQMWCMHDCIVLTTSVVAGAQTAFAC